MRRSAPMAHDPSYKRMLVLLDALRVIRDGGAERHYDRELARAAVDGVPWEHFVRKSYRAEQKRLEAGGPTHGEP